MESVLGHPLTPENKTWLRARDRAYAKTQHGPVPLLSSRDPKTRRDSKWAVIGSDTSGAYMVSRLDEHGFKYSCDCVAGRHGNVCWHAAYVADLPAERLGRAEERKRRAIVRQQILAEEAKRQSKLRIAAAMEAEGIHSASGAEALHRFFSDEEGEPIGWAAPEDWED